MTHRQSVTLFGPIACMLAAMGCAAESQVDLGKSNPPGLLGASLTDYQGAWAGYVEAHTWSDGSDAVRLTLDGRGRGALQIGAPNTPPPDFDVRPDEITIFPIYSRLAPGFDYTIVNATISSRRIQIKTSTRQVYRDWCPTFTPVPDVVNGGFGCRPNVGVIVDGSNCYVGDAQRTPIACAADSCFDACVCDETSCRAFEDSDDILIDAALMLEGEELAGTLLLARERINIRMLRSE